MSDVVFFGIINAQLMAAGAFGGLVHAFQVEKATPLQVVGFIVCGAMAANFIAPQALKILTMFPDMFVAFGIGLSGKRLCYLLEKAFDKVLGKPEND